METSSNSVEPSATRSPMPALLALLEASISETVEEFVQAGLPLERAHACLSALEGLFVTPLTSYNVQ
ncbi:MAG: hypothetical protein K1X79_06380 [Oligoflexia bacterium]|nr:hypothetical protein [Oligoflexia bacterium]